MKIKIYILILIIIFLILNIVSCEKVKGAEIRTIKNENEKSIEELNRELNPITIRNLNDYFSFLKYGLKVEDSSIDTIDHAYDIFIDGNYAYLVTYFGELYIINIQDKNNPKIVSNMDTPGDDTMSVFIDGDYTFLADGDHFNKGLLIVDIKDKENPKIISSLDTPGDTMSVFIDGNYAFLADGESGLTIVDIKDKENPKIISSLNTPGDAMSVFIDGNYAFLADGESGLQIIDITEKNNPKPISNIYTPGNAMSVFVDGNYAYLADGESGLALIVSIEDKYNPKIISTLATSGLAYRICTSGNYAYLADGENGLLIININDKREPSVLEKILIPTGNFFIEDNYAYIVDEWDGFIIIDLINRDYPEVVKSINIPNGCYEIITKIENNIYIIGDASRFIIIDVKSLNQPELNILDTDNVETALVDENIAYIISHYIDSDNNINRYIEIFDLTNKDEPDSKSSVKIQDEIYDIGKKDNHLFLAGREGLKILEISDEYKISYGNNFEIPGNTYHIEIVDDFAFVSNSENGLMIIDISDINNLKTISKIPNTGSSFCIDGNYVYAATDFGLSIINISDKNNPIMINSIDTLGGSIDIYKANNLIYLVYYLIQNKDTQEYEWSNIIQVIDVSDLKDLKIIKNIKTPGYPTSVLADGNYVYVGAYEVGLLVFNIKN